MTGLTSFWEHHKHGELRALPENEDKLYQLSKEKLVEIIKTLQEKIVRLEESLKLDSQISSKPTSTDLFKKSEKKKLQPDTEQTTTKGKPGGQPGHEGKTRKRFGPVERTEILRPQMYSHCGGTHFAPDIEYVETQQVAQFVANLLTCTFYNPYTVRL